MPRDLDYAADILAAARSAFGYVDDIAYEEFILENMRQDAVVRQLLIVGEAAKRLSDEFKAIHPELPIRQMSGMRDILVHSYDHVDLDEVWRVATVDLKALIVAMELLLETGA